MKKSRTRTVDSNITELRIKKLEQAVELLAKRLLSVSGAQPPGPFTAGSVIFSDGSSLAQDNANFFWDDTNNRLGIRTTTPGTMQGGWNFAFGSVLQMNAAASEDSALTLSAGSGRFARIFMENQLGTAGNRVVNIDQGANVLTFRSLSEASGNAFKDNILVLNTNTGNVGIGTTTPDSRLDIEDGALSMQEMTAPAAPAANKGVIYCDDNGSGKTRLNVRFPTGAVQVIATEP